MGSGLPDLIMVFDDYHAIKNQEVHDVCSYLLNNIPANIHLIITSRMDPPLPLAYMQIHNDLFELRLPQLRFETEETRSYLMEAWKIALTSGELDELQKRTDGWIASLQLLAMSLSHLEDSIQRNSFIAEFGHSKRLIYQILAEEVLSQQPDDIRNFLLETSILAELTPELCQEITKNPKASDLLTRVYRRNLFLSGITGQMSLENAFRYHDLFATFLKQRLLEKDPDLFRTLHYRAAMAVHDPLNKVQHFLLAEEVGEAAKILESIGRADLKTRNISRQTYKLIFDLPEKERSERVWLLLSLGAYHAQRGQIGAAVPFIEKAENIMQSCNDEQAEIELLMVRAWMEGNSSDETVAAINRKFEICSPFV